MRCVRFVVALAGMLSIGNSAAADTVEYRLDFYAGTDKPVRVVTISPKRRDGSVIVTLKQPFDATTRQWDENLDGLIAEMLENTVVVGDPENVSLPDHHVRLTWQSPLIEGATERGALAGASPLPVERFMQFLGLDARSLPGLSLPIDPSELRQFAALWDENRKLTRRVKDGSERHAREMIRAQRALLEAQHKLDALEELNATYAVQIGELEARLAHEMAQSSQCFLVYAAAAEQLAACHAESVGKKIDD